MALQADLLIDGKSTTCIERVYMVQYHTISHLDYMVQWIRQWTCNSQVVSSIPSGDIFFFIYSEYCPAFFEAGAGWCMQLCQFHISKMKLHYEPYHVSKEGSSGMKTEIVVCPFLKNSLYLRNFRGPKIFFLHVKKIFFFDFFFLIRVKTFK